MKALGLFKDPLLLGGFVSNLFNGFLNPLYISAILGKIEPKLISIGSFMASAFPALLGVLMENTRLFETLFRFLPILMAGEVFLTALVIYTSKGNAAVIYLAGMFIFGIFSTSILYLLQRVKEVLYQGDRARWDRRIASADALGYLLGSALVALGEVEGQDPTLIAVAGLMQTVLVYTFFLVSYLSVRRKLFNQVEEEVPPQWGWNTFGRLAYCFA
ncbi:MAG: hypothetical protein N2442_08465 [Spirochaetes bacterium]|nr:hypothetical protein [Spirochaetota bacterium]